MRSRPLSSQSIGKVILKSLNNELFLVNIMNYNSAERAQTAGNIVRAMSSRPTSGTKSVAWSEDVAPDPEAGNLTPIKEIDPALKDEPYSKELEEELNRDPMEDKENITMGCWAQFTAMISSEYEKKLRTKISERRLKQNLLNFLTGMWDTTDMAVGEEREVLVRTTLRELVVYLVYLVILCCGENTLRSKID